MAVRANTETYAPHVTGETLVYDADLATSLRGIDVLAPGTLLVLDLEGNEWKHTFAGLDPSATEEVAYSNFPYRLELQIKQIVGDGSGAAATDDSGTSIALANLIGLR